MEHSGRPWAEHSPHSYKGAINSTAAMAEGLERDIELLEIHEVSAWRQQLGAAAAGLFTAGPIGLIASLIAFRKLDGQWLPWALIGVLAAPPLAYGQWRGMEALQRIRAGGDEQAAADLAAAQLMTEADRIARSCALAQREGSSNGSIRNPLDGSDLFCDPSYPATVVITSRSFAPLQQPRSCGGRTLAAGTSAAQWLVSPAGSLVCEAIASSSFWWWERAAINRQVLSAAAPKTCAGRRAPASAARPISSACAITAPKNGPCWRATGSGRNSCWSRLIHRRRLQTSRQEHPPAQGGGALRWVVARQAGAAQGGAATQLHHERGGQLPQDRHRRDRSALGGVQDGGAQTLHAHITASSHQRAEGLGLLLQEGHTGR
jgi:hypothetical protein